MRHVARMILLALFASAALAEDVVEMAPVHAQPSQFVFQLHYNPKSNDISEVLILEIRPGSNAEKLGLKPGDFLTVLDGVPVAGRKRSDLVWENGRVRLQGQLTFVRRRTFFRKEWILTLDASELGPMYDPKKP
ncbi:MAG TPA: hypothetical protein VG838_03960 [Opitutaceae bacterium]|nr:hypothetical protein [Opitutaceae bacterium]